jgi:hypothetical protein
MFPLTTYCQSGNERYEQLIDLVVDSILRNDSNDYFISEFIERKTDFSDLHGVSSNCEIQHQLLLEILTNGEQSEINEYKLKSLIPEYLNDKSKEKRIDFSTIVSYGNIWFTVLTVKDLAIKENRWTKYSLIFIDNKLVEQIVGEWHGE